MSAVRKVTHAFRGVDLAIRSADSPVKDKRDRVLNIEHGFLFDLFAMNWLHAPMHLLVGETDLPAGVTSGSSDGYMRLQATLFAPYPRWAG